VAGCLGRGQPERLPAIVWTSTAVQVGLGVVAAAGLALFAPLLSTRVLGVPAELQADALASLYLVALALPALLAAAAFRGVLEAAQRFDLYNAVRIPSMLAVFVLPLVGLWLGWGLIGILVLLLASRVAMAVAYLVVAIRLFPQLARPRLMREGLAPIVSFGAWSTLSGMTSPLLHSLDRFVLGAVLSTTALGYYAVPFDAVMRILIVPANLVAVLFPAFSSLGGGNRLEEVDALVIRSLKYVLLLLAPVSALLVLGAEDLLGLWLGADFARESGMALRVLAIGILFNGAAFIAVGLLQGLGRAELPGKLGLIELPFAFVLAVICIKLWGITGAAVAWSVRVAIDAVLLFALAHRIRPLRLAVLRRERVPELLGLVVATGVATAWLVAYAVGPAQRLVVLGGAGLVLLSVIWRFGLPQAERESVGRVFQLRVRP
jgi:O-antigen/teichoic acid export membrane protein